MGDAWLTVALAVVPVALSLASPVVRKIWEETFRHPRRRSVIVVNPETGEVSSFLPSESATHGRHEAKTV